MIFSLAFFLSGAACALNNFVEPASENFVKRNKDMPPVILWVWERPEDLRFLDSGKFGAAFLAQTLFLRGDEVIRRPRRQEFLVAPETYLIAVTRIETRKAPENKPIFSDAQRRKIVFLIKDTLKLPNVRAVQIDFDAVASERGFYRELIFELRRELPDDTPLTMTSLASWCVGDLWFGDFPVDEAVPMIFEMGADDKKIREFLAKGSDWNAPLCRGSYGVSIEEPLEFEFKTNRRLFFFKRSAWKKSDLQEIEGRQ